MALLACSGSDAGPPAFRGPGMKVASLELGQQAAVNAVAVNAAFNPDPSLSLLLDPVYLPRTAGKTGGGSVAPALIARMKQRGVVRGTCQTPREGPRAVPVCPAALPGYVSILVPAVLVGGWLGAEYGSRRFANPVVRRVLAVVLALAGAKMIAV